MQHHHRAKMIAAGFGALWGAWWFISAYTPLGSRIFGWVEPDSVIDLLLQAASWSIVVPFFFAALILGAEPSASSEESFLGWVMALFLATIIGALEGIIIYLLIGFVRQTYRRVS